MWQDRSLICFLLQCVGSILVFPLPCMSYFMAMPGLTVAVLSPPPPCPCQAIPGRWGDLLRWFAHRDLRNHKDYWMLWGIFQLTWLVLLSRLFFSLEWWRGHNQSYMPFFGDKEPVLLPLPLFSGELQARKQNRWQLGCECQKSHREYHWAHDCCHHCHMVGTK